jgi:hypothetical protein
MPAVSKKQRQAMAIAEHEPEKLYERNRGLLKMSHGQLHDFAATKERGLADRITNLKRKGKLRSKKPPPMGRY